jgi:hypothetical protein
MRRLLALMTLMLAAAACSGPSSPSSTATSETTPPLPAETRESSLVGTWSRVTTCEEFVKAQTRAGFKEVVLEGVAGNGFLPGVSKPNQIANPAHPCEGAIPREHSHFFTQDGQFGSLDWNGKQVDDGTYEIIDDSTFVIGDATFHYEISGDTIRFDPVIPSDCTTKDCRGMASWMVAVAYPGKTWERVG